MMATNVRSRDLTFITSYNFAYDVHGDDKKTHTSSLDDQVMTKTSYFPEK